MENNKSEVDVRLVELNRRNQEFWKEQSEKVRKQIEEHPEDAAAAAEKFSFRSLPSFEYFMDMIQQQHPKKRGRPRKDDDADKVQRLRNEGLSWSQVKSKMDKETGEVRSQTAYRNLLGSRKR